MHGRDRVSSPMKKGGADMANTKEEMMTFHPFLKGSDASTKGVGWKIASPYKVALFVVDCSLVMITFAACIMITGIPVSFLGDFGVTGALLMICIMIGAFFPTFNLYNYHQIFSAKGHIKNFSKAFGWSILSIAILILFYSRPDILKGRLLIPVLIVAATGILLVSRFYGDQLLFLLKSMGLGFLALGIIGLINPYEKPIFIEEWIQIAGWAAIAFMTILAGRMFLVHVVFNKWLRRQFRRQLAIIGSDSEAERITNHVINQNAPFWVRGVIDKTKSEGICSDIPKNCLGRIQDLPRIVGEERLDELIVTDENTEKRTLISLLDYCTSQGITVWFPPRLMPIIDMKLYIDSFCGLPMIRMCSQKNSWLFNKMKHCFDALITLPFCLILLPVFAVVGIVVKLNSPGPMFYKAEAVGKNGWKFKLYKFRSMRVNNSHDIHKDYVTKFIDGEIGQMEKEDHVFKITDDPRVTSVGKVLRKYSIDELPQLLNVLKGDMSLVGPRPCLPYEYEIYKDWHKKRLSIRPGITCLWQVSGRSAVTFEDMILLDLYYIYNRNFLMDMNIIYETFFAVLDKRGAH